MTSPSPIAACILITWFPIIELNKNRNATSDRKCEAKLDNWFQSFHERNKRENQHMEFIFFKIGSKFIQRTYLIPFI